MKAFPVSDAQVLMKAVLAKLSTGAVLSTDEAEQAFTKEELQAVGIDDLGDIRSADALAVTKGLELFRAYKRLAVRDRQRVLKYVIQNETRFTAEEMNKVDISGISPKELE